MEQISFESQGGDESHSRGTLPRTTTCTLKRDAANSAPRKKDCAYPAALHVGAIAHTAGKHRVTHQARGWMASKRIASWLTALCSEMPYPHYLGLSTIEHRNTLKERPA